MRRAEIVRKFDGIVEFSGIEHMLDTPVKRYSSGMYVRLGFSVAAHLEPDILVIDEVLAVGDAPSRAGASSSCAASHGGNDGAARQPQPRHRGLVLPAGSCWKREGSLRRAP